MPLLFVVLFSQCSGDNSQENSLQEKKAQKKELLNRLNVFNALPTAVIDPENNINTPQKIALGKLLFYDPILSGDKDVACATCHHPQNGYAEFRDLSIGVNGKGFGSKRVFKQPNSIPFVKRNAHTILNTAYNGINTNNHYSPDAAPMFWDSRSNSLEEQAVLPIKTFEEMRGMHFSEDGIFVEIVKRLKNIPEYKSLFQEAFDQPEPISEENIGKAIAAFERTLTATNSRFDQYMRGDQNAISLSEKEGFETFKEVGCGNCHNGPMFSDFKAHTLGIPTNEKLEDFDTGIDSTYAFRTPTLRNLRFTAPYMHNGSFSNLKEVLEFYEDIADGKERHEKVGRAQMDILVSDLRIKVKDMAPIISFLNALNDPDFDKGVPSKVPSGLPVGGDIGL